LSVCRVVTTKGGRKEQGNVMGWTGSQDTKKEWADDGESRDSLKLIWIVINMGDIGGDGARGKAKNMEGVRRERLHLTTGEKRGGGWLGVEGEIKLTQKIGFR